VVLSAEELAVAAAEAGKLVYMRELIFATGNSRKISEATAVLKQYDVKFEACKVDIDEIQHYDCAEITKAKARAAFAVVGQPVVVSDTSWDIPALGGFPGGYMKDIANWWQSQDWLNVMAAHEDKRIFCLEHVAYFDGKILQHFEAKYEGRFISEARGRGDQSESFEKVVILYGDMTMAEQLAAGEVASAGEDLTHWKLFAEWYSKRATK